MTISRFDTLEVQITSVYFRPTAADHSLESYPKRMVVEGREVNLLEQSMRYIVRKGQELVRLFDVSDGETNYRLRLDNADHWTLVSRKAAV